MKRKDQLKTQAAPCALQVEERKCPHCGSAFGGEKPPAALNDNFSEPRYIAVNQGCVRWSRCRGTIYKLLNRNLLVAIKDGKSTLLDVAVGDAYFASLPRYASKSGVDQ